MFGAAVAISRLHVRVCPKCDSFALSKVFMQHPKQEFVNYNLGRISQATRNFGGWRSAFLNGSWREHVIGWKQISRQTLSKSNVLKRFKSTSIANTTNVTTASNPLIIRTNIKNNVMLYRFEKDILMRGALAFGVFSMIGCLIMADNVFLILCKDLMRADIPLKKRLYDHIFPLAAISIGLLAGPIIIGAVWYITVRTIKYIILHKGGQDVTIVTYHPFKKFKKVTIPLANVSCKATRGDAKAYALISIKNMNRQLIIDKKGQFINPELFDCTVGVLRI